MDFLGLRVTRAPLVETSLPLRRGLNVLYGLNGAGKSNLLNALYSTLTGKWQQLDGTPIAPGQAALFASSSRLARQATFAPDFGDPRSLWNLPGHPYRPSDRAQIADLLLAAQESRLVALVPTDAPTSAWTIKKAVNPEEVSAAQTIADRENAYLRLLRHRLMAEDEEADGLAREWGFDEDDDDISLMEGSEYLYLRSALDPALYTDDSLLMDLPDDGLPYAVVPNVQAVSLHRQIWDWGLPGVSVVTNLGLESLAEFTATGVAGIIDKGIYVDDRWVDFKTDDIIDRLKTLAPSVEGVDALGLLPRHLTTYMAETFMLERWLAMIADLANDLLGQFLLDPPRIIFRLSNEPLDRVGGSTFDWTAEQDVPLIALSRAERGWVTLALRLSVVALTHGNRDLEEGDPMPTADDLGLAKNTFVIIDEPEAALHRAAESHMADGLSALVSHSDFYMVIATHSPHILNLGAASVHRVHRSETLAFDLSEDEETGNSRGNVLVSMTKTTPLQYVERNDLELLGLQPSDLLNRVKTYLLIEGRHDEMIIGHFLHDTLQQCRAELLPLRGATQLPFALHSRLLYDFTDASIVTVIDNLSPTHVQSTWAEAQSLAITEGTQRAGEYLRHQLPASKEHIENKFLREFLSRALEMGVESRVTPYPLSKRDILMYLPVDALIPRATSWDQILNLDPPLRFVGVLAGPWAEVCALVLAAGREGPAGLHRPFRWGAFAARGVGA